MNGKKLFNIILVILWMILIFTMSSFNATESGEQSGMIVDFINQIIHVDNIKLLSLIIRKLAHFTEYFVLGILVANAFYKCNKKLFLAIIICVIYAISDEIHQIFVSGRSCQLLDIIIDSLGSITGIFIYKIFKKL